MIRIVRKGEQSFTYLYCDHCNKRITESASAVAVWPISRQGETIKESSPQYVHKDICHDAIKEWLGAHEYKMGSDELRTHLRALRLSVTLEDGAGGTTGKVAS